MTECSFEDLISNVVMTMVKSENMSILFTNIQKFSLHDGPGIRTTVFLKGCSLRCPWCSNPENLLPYIENYSIAGEKGVYGKYISDKELVKECLKDRNFYDGKLSRGNWNINTADQIEDLPGGVTFSGGEALLQIKELMPVIQSLHSEGVHITVETSLFCSSEQLSLAIKLIDLFYVDIKMLDPIECKKAEKGELSIYLNNIDVLMNSSKPIIVRIPVIGGYTDNEGNRLAVKTLLEQYKNSILKVELVKEHNLGLKKYESLGMKVDYHGVDDSIMDIYKAELMPIGIPIEICKI